jgi:hypothetical protein
MARRPLICARHAARALRTLRALRMLHALRAGCIAACAVMAFGCSNYPVDSSGRDLLELETVWQYLKAYSIWQDSVPLPQNAFTYEKPETLLAHVNDTLHGVSYTGYDSSEGARAAGTNNSAPAISYARISPRTAYLHIWKFGKESTLDSFILAVPFLSAYPNIMLDLRWDGGGDIGVLDSIIAYFLPVNTPWLVATYRAYDRLARTASTIRNERWATKHAPALSLAGKKIVVLLNRWSASASEMLAAGIKDGRAASGLGPCLFVGDTSYGKGVGQILISRAWLSKRDLKITYLRVTRACGCADSVYHRKGLVPDVAVTNRDSTVADTSQFVAAFHVLEPGVRPDVVIETRFLKKNLAKEADCLVPAIPELEK